MSNKLILRLNNSIGNQMFMYAAGYSFSKKLNRDFFIDNETSFSSRKNISEYKLNNFECSAKLAPEALKFLNFKGYIKRKFYKKIDYLRNAKRFYVEKKNAKKISNYNIDFFNNNYSRNLFLEGHFESEKYFVDLKNEIFKEFKFKYYDLYVKSPYFKMINDVNSVAICIRQNRFSEGSRNINLNDMEKSKNFTMEQVSYVKKCMQIIKSKINNPKFFLWSNDYTNLDKLFFNDEVIIVNNGNKFNKNKSVLDLFLMTQSKHYIVVPSSFNWWGCWLSKQNNKIVFRPGNNHFSNFKIHNKDLWPESWSKV